MKEYLIMNRSLANHLINRGHQIIRLEGSNKNYGRTVFFFNDSPELREIMAEYSALTKEEKRNLHK